MPMTDKLLPFIDPIEKRQRPRQTEREGEEREKRKNKNRRCVQCVHNPSRGPKRALDSLELGFYRLMIESHKVGPGTRSSAR